MNECYNDSFEIRSNAKYKDISSVQFTPVSEVEIQKMYNKGDWRFWKWLGLIPLIPYKVREDLYKSESWDGLKSLKKGKASDWRWFIKDGKIYRRASVYIERISGSNGYERFNSNEEATKFIQNLRDRCRETGNDLK